MTPIVLHHGFGGFGQFELAGLRVSYFGGIERAIAARGFPVIVSGVHPTAGIERRARQLKANILRQLDILGRPSERVTIFAHSMGGLDARYMISRLGMADRVSTLVTICTPHRGTSYAQWCLRRLGRGYQWINRFGFDIQSLSDLTPEHCDRLNEKLPNAQNVRYCSISAARPWHRVPPFALHAHRVISKLEGENDALVSVRSAQWGEHLGTWPADHWHTLNRRWVVELREPTGSIIPYWLKLLDRVTCGISPIDSQSPAKT